MGIPLLWLPITMPIKDMADRVVKLRDGMIRKNYCNEHKLSASELEW